MKGKYSEAKRGRFPGLKLKPKERTKLRGLERSQKHRRLEWIRIRALLLLDQGLSVSEVAAVLGTYPRTVRRVGWRYIERGVDVALEEEQRPKEEPMLSERDQALIVAMVCSDPPEGSARWTLALIVREIQARKIVQTVGRETIRQMLHRHDLKPWRENNVVRAEARRDVHRADGEPAGALRKAG